MCYVLPSFLNRVIQQPAVAGAIVGCRLGLKDHITETQKVFSFSLDSEDLAAIADAARQRDLIKVIGEVSQCVVQGYKRRALIHLIPLTFLSACYGATQPGDEYRYRS